MTSETVTLITPPAMETHVYPKRDSFHAHRVVRQMMKACVALYCGQTAALLVAIVAHTEDAAHYRRPVYFYDAQLMMLVGVASWRALARARQAAIEAGWLHFEPGGKRRPGRYWTLIPQTSRDIDDAPTDEGEAAEDNTIQRRSAGQNAVANAVDNGMHLRKVNSSEIQTSSERQFECDPNAAPPTLSLIPVPLPEEIPPLPPDGGTIKSPETGSEKFRLSASINPSPEKPSREKSTRPVEQWQVEEIYEAYPKKVGKGAALKAIRSALMKVPFEELKSAVEAYSKSCTGKDPQYIPYPQKWFSQERWNDARETWSGSARRSAQDASDPTRIRSREDNPYDGLV